MLIRDHLQYDRSVHRLVLETFVGCGPEGMGSTWHLNSNSKDSRLTNLGEWGTPKENSQDMVSHGTPWLRCNQRERSRRPQPPGDGDPQEAEEPGHEGTSRSPRSTASPPPRREVWPSGSPTASCTDDPAQGQGQEDGMTPGQATGPRLGGSSSWPVTPRC